MKVKILAIMVALAAFLLFPGTGTALARGRDREDGYRYHSRPVAVYHANPKAVHRQPEWPTAESSLFTIIRLMCTRGR